MFDGLYCFSALTGAMGEGERGPQVFSDVARTRNGLLSRLLARGFDVNSQTPDGRTVLHRVAAGNELDEVRALIAHGANPNLTEHHYKPTPLGFALHNRAWDVARYLKDFSDNLFDRLRMSDAAGVRQLPERHPATRAVTAVLLEQRRSARDEQRGPHARAAPQEDGQR